MSGDDQATTFGSAQVIIPAGMKLNGIYGIDEAVTAAGMGKMPAPRQAPNGFRAAGLCSCSPVYHSAGFQPSASRIELISTPLREAFSIVSVVSDP